MTDFPEIRTSCEEESDEIKVLLKKNPNLLRENARWILLFLLMLIEAINVIGNDYPAPFQVYLQGKHLNLSSLQYNALISGSGISTALSCFFGGYLVNLLGPSKALYIITVCHSIGFLLFSIGVAIPFYPLLLLARFFNGVGEANFLCYSILVQTWFKNMEISLSFSILVNGGRILAYGLTLGLTYLVLYSGSLTITMFSGFGISLIAVFLTAVMDILGNKFVAPNSYKHEQELEEVILEPNILKYISKQLEYFKKISLNAYLLSFGTSLFVVVSAFFTMNYNNYFYKIFGVPGEVSVFNFFLSIVLGLPFSLIVSLLLDKYGYRLAFIFVGPISVIIQFLMMAYMDSSAREYSIIIWIFFPLVLTSLSSAFWPMINTLIPKFLYSTAPSIYYISTYTMSAVFSVLYGYIKDETKTTKEGYFWSSYFTLIFSVFSIVIFCILAVRNYRFDLKLNSPHPNL